MIRRLSHLALALTVLASASPAFAGGFAAPPPDAARAPVADYPYEPEPSMIKLPARPGRRVLPPAARARVRATLARRRAANLKAFASYVKRGRYPHNYEDAGRLNVWRDRDGRLCAAATMILRSGARALVDATARDANFIRLADVTEGPLLDWILTSGLTHEEVVAIQEPFMGRPEPAMPTRAWQQAEDARLRARYREVRGQLARSREASLDAAVDALAGRPDLVAALL